MSIHLKPTLLKKRVYILAFSINRTCAPLFLLSRSFEAPHFNIAKLMRWTFYNAPAWATLEMSIHLTLTLLKKRVYILAFPIERTYTLLFSLSESFEAPQFIIGKLMRCTFYNVPAWATLEMSIHLKPTLMKKRVYILPFSINRTCAPLFLLSGSFEAPQFNIAKLMRCTFYNALAWATLEMSIHLTLTLRK